MPLLILEGPDGSGKSTLAAKLLKGTGHPTLLVKRSGPPGRLSTLLSQSRWIKEQSLDGLNIIADRHPLISEAIYKPIVRKEGPADWTIGDVASRLAEATPAELLVIFCRSDFRTMKAGSEVEQQMAGVKDYYEPLCEEYDRWYRVFREYGVAAMQYDWKEEPHAEHVITTVRNFWELTHG